WFSRGPAISISPIDEPGFQLVPEAVEERYFSAGKLGRWEAGKDSEADASFPASQGSSFPARRFASFGRESTRNLVEQMAVRLHRFRDDVDVLTFHEPPKPDELASLDAWFDPAIDADDFDGFSAEALV